MSDQTQLKGRKTVRTAARRKTAQKISGFTEFVRTQGVVGLAVGLAIGTAAGSSVKAIVDGFINPIVGFILGGANLATLVWHTGFTRGSQELIIYWGAVANSALTLLATASVIYFLVQGFHLDKLDKKKS